MAALRRHAQGPRRPIGSPPRAPLEDLARAAPVLRAQPQPAREVLLRRELAQVQPQLTEQHQSRRLADALNLRQIDPRHAEEQAPRSKVHRILVTLALAQTGRQGLVLALVRHALEAGLDLLVAFL
jgi:hypothetical protein